MAEKQLSSTSRRRATRSPSTTRQGVRKADQISLAELRAMLYDLDVPDAKIRPYLRIDDARSGAFAPVATIDPQRVDTDGEEAAVALGLFNNASRWRRQARYRRKIQGGFQGVKIVSEGDSWFQYPWLLDDVIDHLFDDYAIFCLSAAGDELHEMLLQDEFSRALREERPDIFLISGGGNDLFGGGRLATVLHAQAGVPASYPNAAFDELMARIIEDYRQLFTRLTTEHPGLRVLCHGYDYAIPARGQWLGTPMASLGIEDAGLQRDIIRVIVDRFYGAMAELADGFPNVHLVDCRGRVGERWHDELHPTNEGFADVARAFRDLISTLTAAGRPEAMRRQPASPGREARVTAAADLEPAAFRRLVARRARALGIDASGVMGSEDARREAEAEISAFFEKLHQEANFLPARFLRDGAERAKAVCRIRAPGALGTGFLIGSRQYLMTNNHVLPSADIALASVAELGFEEGAELRRLTLQPQRFFITDKTLDFTIVACDGEALTDVEPLELLRDPATVTRGEAVNIIQHPSGRAKEIAIHDNGVIRVQDRVLHYRTDTEPGSSGSPVFNNDWQLVALHHAGWQEEGGSATNEGIRISAIVAHLLSVRQGWPQAAGGLLEVLGQVADSSPYLGFFDAVGVVADAQALAEPDLQGEGGPDFADLGVWTLAPQIGEMGADLIPDRIRDRIRDQIEEIAQCVNRLSMDVLGLVGVPTSLLGPLIERLRAAGDDIGYLACDEVGGSELAVLYDRDTTEAMPVPAIAERNREHLEASTAGGRRAFARAPWLVRCRVVTGNRVPVDLLLILVPGPGPDEAASRAQRRLAAQSLAAVIEDVRRTERLPVLLAGDLDEALANEVLAALTATPDLFTVVTDDAAARTAALVGHSRRSLVDHLVISGDLRPGRVLGEDAAITRIARRAGDLAPAAADQVPLILRIVMREAPIDVPQPEAGASCAAAPVDLARGEAQLAVPAGVRHLRVRAEGD